MSAAAAVLFALVAISFLVQPDWLGGWMRNAALRAS
ncbi:hypothetical protein BH18CHL2_BH18CHL2_13010 [soil metagenome]